MKHFKYCPMCKTELVKEEVCGIERLLCSDCGWINYINPLPAVACVVRDGEGRILLVKRAAEPEAGKWSLPAGFIELGESPAEAAMRELKEETGLDGTEPSLIGVYSDRSSIYGGILTIGYLFTHICGDLAAGDDASDVKFTVIENIDNIPFRSHRILLRESGV
ncbi:MAG: NUDIX hydrolase [Elusimicrobiota bacterium]